MTIPAAQRTLVLPGVDLQALTPAPAIHRSARISLCGTYRYDLARIWGDAENHVLWIMLIPSTADADRDDATIRTIIAFSKAWGFGSLRVCNLFAFRATDPKDLRRAAREKTDIIGPENDRTIEAAARAARRVVVAWGRHGRLLDRDWQVNRLLLAGVAPVCLGTNDDKTPRHPLYLPRSTQPVPFQLGECR